MQNSSKAEGALVALCCEDPTRLESIAELSTVDFSDLRWRAAMTALRGIEIYLGDGMDIETVAKAVSQTGSALMVSDITAALISSSELSIPSYVEIVARSAAKRRLELGVSAGINALRNGATVNETLSRLSLVLKESSEGQQSGAKTPKELVTERFLELAELTGKIAKGEASAIGIPTGVDSLDERLGGYQRGIVTLIAARPAMGKSLLAMIGTRAAAAAGIGTHVFSLEDTESAYTDRLLSATAKIPTDAIRNCRLTIDQLGRLRDAADRISGGAQWLVDSRSGISPEEIVRSARREAPNLKTGLVVVDYIQLVRSEHGDRDPRTVVSHAMECFMDAAKRDDCAYLVLSQLNRGCESREDKRPLLSDLKESGALEERSKACVMMYRGVVYDHRASATEVELLIRKNSNGQTGMVKAGWHPERMEIS